MLCTLNQEKKTRWIEVINPFILLIKQLKVVPHNFLIEKFLLWTPTKISSSEIRSLKGKRLVFSPPIFVEMIKPRIPFTRSSTKKHILVEEGTSKASSQQKDKTHPLNQPIEIIEIISPSHESNPTFKRLGSQLKDTEDEKEKLEENMEVGIKLKNMLYLYENTIDK
jgi:hypothetical protein